MNIVQMLLDRLDEMTSANHLPEYLTVTPEEFQELDHAMKAYEERTGLWQHYINDRGDVLFQGVPVKVQSCP